MSGSRAEERSTLARPATIGLVLAITGLALGLINGAFGAYHALQPQ
jgi:hypothetical protein